MSGAGALLLSGLVWQKGAGAAAGDARHSGRNP
jgi:hypothetical protein